MTDRPPWRDRIGQAAATPVPKIAPFRTSTGAWRTMFGLVDRGEDKERFTEKKLPESWKSAAQDLPIPVWARATLLWLLDVPRWIYIVAGSLVVIGGLTMIVATVSLYDYLSRPVAIPTPKVGSATQTGHVYAADGTLIADLHGAINRQSVPLSQMSGPLKQAVLAAEDGGFYRHRALDFQALVRAMFRDVLAGQWIEGGSTITQQYVKLVYVGQQRTFRRKIAEARLAYQIERRLPKDQILERYLNTVYFGRGAYGVQAAALTYFRKPASDLDISESSLLAGILASPTAFSPDANPSSAEARRQYVLDRMESLGFISAVEADQARGAKPALSPPPQPNTIALRYPWFVDTVRSYLFQKYGEALTLGGGLDVQTALDPRQQDAAEAAVAKALPKSSDPYAALVSVDPKTGYVTSMVGGRDFTTEKFNVATLGRRQPGSAMKPFVLVAALEKGISPQTVYNGPAEICLAGWLPTCEVHTYENESFGPITLETATIHSVNTVYAQLIMQVGPANVVNVANRMGIPGPSWLLPTVAGCRPEGSPACTAHLDAVPSLALGSQDVSPLEMASAYAVLADHGIYHEPKFVSRVTTSDGQVLESGPSKEQQVLNPTIVTTVNRILSEVITMGTGTAANLGRPAAGKTGTTEDYRNAWFVGYTPQLATSVWVGYRNANQPLIGVEGVPKMAGGTIPAQIWASYMKAALPPATDDTRAADATDLGLNNAPTSNQTATVGTQTVTTTSPGGVPYVCTALPSTTVVGPPPSPGGGTEYNQYPYLRCSGATSGGGAGPPPEQGATPTDTSAPAVATTPTAPSPESPLESPVESPVPTPTPSPPPRPCLLGIVCG